MKKISLALLAAVVSASIAQAAPFKGAYLGASAGFVQRNVKTTINLQQPGLGNYNKSKKVNGLDYGVFGGYGWNSNGFYYGAELGLSHTTANKFTSHNLRGIDFRTKFERGPVLNIAPRLGAVFAGSYLGYAKLAVEFSRDRAIINFPGANDTYNSKKKTSVVFVPGIGIEKAFGNVLARIEYNYNLGVKRSFDDKEGNIKDVGNLKYTAHTVKVGLAWQF